MSTCPTKDLHSLYLDGELPEIYKTEYEAHLNNCPKCRSELEKLQALKTLLHSDSEDTLSSKQLDESYERLLTKMKYSKNTGKSEKKNFGGFKYIIPAAAAAAVFALVIPIRVSTNSSIKTNSTPAETAYVSPVLRNSNSVSNVSFGSGRNVSISGNMNGTGFSSSGVTANPPIARDVSENSVANRLIKNADVFRPEFADEKTKSIKITVPNMNALPFTVEIEFPDSVVQALGSEFNK